MNEQTVVLVTGALSGIGRATALAFAHTKARIVISGRRADEGHALADTLRSLGAEAEFIAADVRVEDDVQALVERTLARFGKLDIAVNAAGTEGESAPVVEQTVERYSAVFDANVLGTLLAMKHQLRAMSAQRSGSIVNVSSTMGARGAAGASLYVASKHAVEGLTKSAALEAAAFGVRVNAVAPGPVQTQMLDRLTQTSERKAAFLDTVPLKRAGTPDEIAEAIVYVASAGFMTGEVLRVNGGRTAT
ncbi:SDR family oxidoreductase (plasmid) [Paraburkholderia sp. PGU19]|uniref:SDR family NAD(P)-dependent oxidoreductase n=1 Tax=Paraburkholderia sp. PGU19 TaxID=2735434 RepID=UPI0015DAEA9F|nr:glucose 1-dehydrogenase [Paraburkholderia sp. PGU19]BCG03142.1 SDR family oxidoreductase [Paraburkholderia sp. PGU19]